MHARGSFSAFPHYTALASFGEPAANKHPCVSEGFFFLSVTIFTYSFEFNFSALYFL